MLSPGWNEIKPFCLVLNKVGGGMLPLNLVYNIEKHSNPGSSNISPLDCIPDVLLTVSPVRLKFVFMSLFVLLSVVSTFELRQKFPFGLV